MYDYIIVGAGPGGLTLATLLARSDIRIAIIDSNSDIGGCHRVTRSGPERLFTEHSPRIYSSSFANAINILKFVGVDFYRVFVPYKFNAVDAVVDAVSHFTMREIMWLFVGFLYPASRETMLEYITRHQFSAAAIDYIDRLCVFTEGCGADRMPIREFMELINYQSGVLYEPRVPNDTGIFSSWKKHLVDHPNVDIILNTDVTGLLKVGDHITGVALADGAVLTAGRYVLALPPPAIARLLPEFTEWSRKTQYNVDIAATFHWDTQLTLPAVWGFPSSEWAVVHIVMSDYMADFGDTAGIKTVISAVVTRTNTASSATGLTANETDTSAALLSEILRQLRYKFPDLPEPTYAVLNPNIARMENMWTNSDSGYVSTVEDMKMESKTADNLFIVGKQNGASNRVFTSMESAVTNAIAAANQLEPDKKFDIATGGGIGIRWFLLIILVLLVALAIAMFHAPGLPTHSI